MKITEDLMYRLLIQGISDYAIYMVDRDGLVINWNAGAQRVKGYTASEIVGRGFDIFYSAQDRAAGVPSRNLVEASRTGRVSLEGWRLRRDRSAFWASATIDAIFDGSGMFVGFAKITRDLTEQHELMKQVEHEANHDGLTRLLNRSGLLKRLETELATERSLAIYYLDLDGFKPINDRLGHAAGDKVLQEVARRLSALVSGIGFAGRIGGDEFVVVQSRQGGAAETASMSARILNALRDPIRVDGELTMIGSSVGTAKYPEDGRNVENLLGLADAELYKAKDRWRAFRGRSALEGPPVSPPLSE